MEQIREMPDDTSEPTKYAGREQEFALKSAMKTAEGKKVIIVDYLKEKGLYVVANIDPPGTVSPLYRISPDKLSPLEQEK